MSDKAKVDFSKDLKELEAIVESLETGEIDLDKSLDQFEKGMELANRLKNYLDDVENRVEVIKKKFDTSEENPAEE
jgi:exodeoxyribonuclease VII small subunit